MSRVQVEAHKARVRETMKVDVSPGNIETCRRFCGSCPTYKENSLIQGSPMNLFCAQGKSDKADVITKKTCNCPICGVHKRYGLDGEFYCTR